MEKSLRDRIANRVSKQKNLSNSKNKVAFIALKKGISEALSAGWSMKVIWETLSEEGKISFSYKTFRTYVARLLVPNTPDYVIHECQNLKEDKTRESKLKPGIIPAFTFHAKPNPEELL